MDDAKKEQFSFTVTLPSDLYDLVTERMKKSRRSRTKEVEIILEAYFAEELSQKADVQPITV